MVVNVSKADKPVEKAASEVVVQKTEQIALVAHQRYWFQGTVFEKQNTYTVTEEQARTLLSLRTARGTLVFLRTKDIKPKEIPAEAQGPKSVDATNKKFIAGMPMETAAKVFNVTTPEEEAAMEAEIQARAQNEGQNGAADEVVV